MKKYWICARAFTVQVNTEGGTIIWAAPIVRRFVGQPLEALLKWAAKFGKVTWIEL